MNEPGGKRTASEPHPHFPSSGSKPCSPSNPPAAPSRASVLLALAAHCPEGVQRRCGSPASPQEFWGLPHSPNSEFQADGAECRGRGPARPHNPPDRPHLSTCRLVLPTPVARGLLPASSRSAYPRTGDPSRPPRRLRLRIRLGGRRYSAGTLAERKATGARSSRPRSPAGAPELTRAGRSVRPGRPDFEPCPPFPLIPVGAPPRTQVVLVGDGREGLMQAVVPHCQRLALLTALVVAVLAEHHGQLLRLGSGDRVGKRKRAQSGPQASCGSSLLPNPQIGFGFLLGSSEREKGAKVGGDAER